MKKLALLFSLLILSACATKPNFAFLEKVAVDQNTGLTWARNSNMPGKQLIWRGDDNVYEYACHEGNHGLLGILEGGRAADRSGRNISEAGDRDEG